MSWEFETVGWEDYDTNRHAGNPSNVGDAYSVLVHAHDTDTDEHDYFWVHGTSFDDWQDWFDLISALMHSHGMELAGSTDVPPSGDGDDGGGVILPPAPPPSEPPHTPQRPPADPGTGGSVFGQISRFFKRIFG